ncbi:TetR family transcriptional regulator [Streptomyces carminius]|uniref:TetR family transcriptional regulator n=1 Tax=Streptomyces carminius TaxID=2665496 RepID=A0A2M8LXF0_9ACTN|nr:TetR family transcriptional regulator [Streptomyces carminius]PJE96646.1 TetR family transcriptional regulator [Streptomyces carminius]
MAPARTSSPSAPKLGLRERKKIRTRQAIRQAAYRLFAEQGYDSTPVDQIAEAAEVSPSTVFRYFPTKEDIVLADGHDPVTVAALRGRPAGEPPVRAVREALYSTVGEAYRADPAEMYLRARLIRDVPAVRARLAEHTEITGRRLREVLSERTGRPAGDLALRVATTAMLGGLTEAMLHWVENDMPGDLAEQVGRALDLLERGLPL